MFMKYGTLGSFVPSHVVLGLISIIAHPLLLFFCLFAFGIVIEPNSKGQLEEQGGGQTLLRLRSGGGGGMDGQGGGVSPLLPIASFLAWHCMHLLP
jgi:hypothetical protein